MASASSASAPSAKGNQLFKDGKYREAISAYREALPCGQGKDVEANLHSNIAICHLKLGEHEAAAQACKDGLRLDASHGKLNFRFAEAALGSKNGMLVAEAIERLDAAIRRHSQPALAELHSQLARLIVVASMSVEVGGEGEAVAAGARIILPPRAKRFAPVWQEVFTSADTLASSSNALTPISTCSFSHSRDGVDENLLVLFHGFGDTPDNFAGFGKGMELPQTAVLSLGGPMKVPLVEGGRGWFVNMDPYTAEPTPPNEIVLARHCEGLYSSLAAVAAARRLPLSNVHLIGYGDGGTMALQVALAAIDFQQKQKVKREVAAKGDLTDDANPLTAVKRWAGAFGSVVSIGGALLPGTIRNAYAKPATSPLAASTNVLLMSVAPPMLSTSSSFTSSAAALGDDSSSAMRNTICGETAIILERLGFVLQDPLVSPSADSPAAGRPTVRHAIMAPAKLLRDAKSHKKALKKGHDEDDEESGTSGAPPARMPRSREDMLPLMTFLAGSLRRRMAGMEDAVAKGELVELGTAGSGMGMSAGSGSASKAKSGSGKRDDDTDGSDDDDDSESDDDDSEEERSGGGRGGRRRRGRGGRGGRGMPMSSMGSLLQYADPDVQRDYMNAWGALMATFPGGGRGGRTGGMPGAGGPPRATKKK